MPLRPSFLSYATSVIVVAATLLSSAPVAAEPRNACTITINSADEREVLRRQLPAGEWRVIELVDRGTPDWLDAACRKGVACDILVISGHFDGGVEFYSDRFDQRESLPLVELERAACSSACSQLFAQLKEVYLFGCNTLNAEVTTSAGAEIEQALLRAGRSAEEAAGAAALLNERHARSNRERMRGLFKDVPVLYGFAAKAPLGHVAGPLLEGHLKAGAWREVGRGQVDPGLVRLFAAASMTTASGLRDGDAQAAMRRDACFFHERSDAARKIAFLHEVLQRDIGEVRILLDTIERFLATLDATPRQREDVARALAAIRDDAASRERFLGYARGAGGETRVRMLDAAVTLGWLTPPQRRAELAAMLAERLAQGPGVADVDLACRLNGDGTLALASATTAGEGAARSALRACLGDTQARAWVIDALASGTDGEFAPVVLRHRPLADAEEFRRIVAHLDRIASPAALARALGVLAQRPLVDAGSFALLTGLFPRRHSLSVQRAIADVLVRADYTGDDRGRLARMLREHRLPAGERDVIDVLIRRLGM